MLRETVARLAPQRLITTGGLRALIQERWPWIVIGLIALIGLAVRAIDVTDNPRGFFTDEASFGLNAHLILTTGKDEHGEFLPLLFRSFGEYKLPAFIYAEAPFVAVFGRSELAVRLTAGFLGSLTLVTTYLLGREVFRRQLPALVGAAFLAILPWHIHYSRTGLGDIVSFPLLLTLALYLFLRAIRTERSLIPAAVVFGLTFYTYRAAWVVLPPLLLLLALLYHQELLKNRRNAFYSAGIVFLFLVPILRHLLSDTTDRSSQAWIFNLKSQKSTLALFWDFYKSYFSGSFLFEKGDNGPITRHYLPGQGVLYWFQLPLIVLGIVALVGRLNRRYLIVLALLLLFPLSGALSDTSPISSRTILGSVVFALLTAAGLAVVVAVLSSLVRPRGALVAGAVVLAVGVLAAVSFSSYLSRYFNDYPRLSAGYWGWQDGPQEIISYFLSVQDRYDQLLMDGEFNAPQEFFPFYAGNKCKKCGIGGTDQYDPARRQLFALRPKNISPDKFNYVVRNSLSYPDGETSFLIVEIRGRR